MYGKSINVYLEMKWNKILILAFEDSKVTMSFIITEDGWLEMVQKLQLSFRKYNLPISAK